MRLLALAPPPTIDNGWGRYTRDLIGALSIRGVEIALLTGIDAPADHDLILQTPLIAYERRLPSVIHAPSGMTARLLASAFYTRQLADRLKADAVHVFAEPYLIAAAAIDTQRQLITVTAHGTYLPRSAARRGVGTLIRRIAARSRIACVSHYTEAQIRAVWPDAHTVVIPNGVDNVRFGSIVHQASDRPTILCVGQMKARKGFHILIQAMSTVRESIPNAQAILIGSLNDSAYVDNLRAQIDTDNLTDAVQIRGRVSDAELLTWYARADLFALPALNTGDKFEGFGLVYLEASAAGLPTIGTRDCGAEDAIRDGETGLLIPQNDPIALAQAIISLLNDPNRRARMAIAGRAFAADHTWESVADQIIAGYR